MHRPMWRRTNQTGFSLIELLVVLTILGLAVAVVPPMLDNTLESATLKKATRDIISGLKQARSNAISQRRPSEFRFDVNKAVYTVESKKVTLDIPATTKVSLTTAQSKLQSASIGSIQFFADGSSTGGRILLEADKTQYRIDVEWLTGRIQISP